MMNNLINHLDKYGSEINLSSHSIEMLILNRIKPNTKVLEFGSGRGKFTRYLHQNKQCKVYAVEINQQYVDEVRPFCEEIIHASIEDYTWKDAFGAIDFDYVIFADVLEHLYNPQQVLLELKSMLSTDTKVLISIPNIAHNSIILGLMNDEFNYQLEGLLDATHIRFFTKKTLDKMFHECGFNISYISANYVGPSHPDFNSSFDGYSSEFANKLCQREYGNVYQFVYELVDEKINLTPIVELEEKLCVAVYHSDNGQFNEDNVIRHWVKDSLQIDMSTLPVVSQLRFDFVECSCLLELRGLSAILSHGVTETITVAYTNASYVDGSKFWFIDNNDPQLVIDIPCGATHINLEWSIGYLFTNDKGNLSVLVNDLSDGQSYQSLDMIKLSTIIKDNNHKISQLNNIIKDNNHKMSQLNDIVQSMSAEIAQLSSTNISNNTAINNLNSEVALFRMKNAQLENSILLKESELKHLKNRISYRFINKIQFILRKIIRSKS